MGNMYQISNQVTMGLGEEDTIKKLGDIVNQIVEAEKKARAMIMDKNPDYIRDKVMRSYGIALYAYTMDTSEARNILSDIILGQNMEIIPKGKVSPVEMLVNISPSIIGGANPAERDKARAKYLRENLK